MSSVEGTEVFIPQQACVFTVPMRSLPSSITKKMPLSSHHSDRPATFISPVELRLKGTTQKPRPLTPGQFFLPVVTSNCKAFKILREFLLSGQISLQFSDESPGADPAFPRRRNSIILFNKQIFLIVRKAKEADWPLEQRSPALSDVEAPPLHSPVRTQNERSDITEGRSQEGKHETGDDGTNGVEGDGVTECEALHPAEDDGKCAEVLKESEAAAMKDANTNTPSTKERRRTIKLEEERSDSAPSGEARSSSADAKDCEAEEGQISVTLTEKSPPGSSLAKAKYCKRVTFSVDQSSSLTSENERQDKSHRKGQISGLEIPADKTGASVRAAEVVDMNRAAQENAEDANEDGAKSKSYVGIQVNKGQRSRCERADTRVNISSEGDVRSGRENAVGTNSGKVKHLFETDNNLKQRSNSQDSSVELKECKSDDISVEVAAECGDLILEKSCAEVESVTAGSQLEVIEVECGGRDGRHGNKTGAGTKREGPGSSAEAEGCESAIQTSDSRLLQKPSNDANRDAKCSNVTLKHGASVVEIVDLDSDDEKNMESGNVHGPQTGDGAKGCKRKIKPENVDETSLDVAAVSWISKVSGSTAKRCKIDDDDDDVKFLSESKPAVDPSLKAKKYDHDVVIIEDDDYKDNKIHRSSNNTSESPSLDERSLEILDLQEHQADDVEYQSSLEKIKSCKRRVSDRQPSLDVRVCTRISEAEDPSTKRFKSANVTKSGGKTSGKSAEARDQDDLINNKPASKAHVCEAEQLLTKSHVEIGTIHNREEVPGKSAHEPNNDGTRLKSAAEGPISEVQSFSGTNKICKPALEIVDTHSEDRTNKTNLRTFECVGSCVKSHVGEVQSISGVDVVDILSDEKNFDMTNGGVCGDSGVSVDQDRALAAKSDSEEPNRDETNRKLSAHGSDDDDDDDDDDDGDDGEEDEHLPLTSVKDKLNPDVAASTSCAAPQISDAVTSSETHQRHASDPETQESGPGQDGRSTRGEEAGVLSRPTSHASHTFDYNELMREENINRIRARIREIEEKCNSLTRRFGKEASGNVHEH